MTKQPIYLDYNATTPVDPRVFEEMKTFLLTRFGNASSKHSFGFEAEASVKVARKKIADLLNADASEIFFTSGATESINIIHLGIAKAYAGRGNHIISTVLEHPAVLDSLKYLEQNGFRVTYLPVNEHGFLNTEQLNDAINDSTILVSVMAANNEIGIINDIKVIGSICNKRNIFFHTDASQALGKIPLDVQEMNIDLMSFSGHKFYAPKGTGGFFLKKKNPSIKISPSIFGGGQEKGLRPGTLNTPGIAALGKAAEICNQVMADELPSVTALRDQLFENLKENIIDIKLNGSMTNRLPNNLNICIPGVDADKLIMETKELAFSAGSACSSGSDKPSHVLKAIGLTNEETRCSVRFSIGRFTTADDIHNAVQILSGAANKIRNYSLKH